MTTSNRQSVNDQAGAARLNSPVQMGSSNPFAPTMENPWQGMNHMMLGSGNRVIQVQTTPISPTHSGPANSLPDDRRKRPRVSTENQVHNFNVNFPHPSSALESIKNDMIGLMETDHKLWQQTKRVRMQIAEKQREAVKHLVDVVTTPLLKKLKEKDEEILYMGKLNIELQEKVNHHLHLIHTWNQYATSSQNKAMSMRNELEDVQAEVNRLKGLLRSYGAVAATHEDQKVKSHCGSNVGGMNTQRNAQGCIRVEVEDAGETAAKNMKG